MEIVHLYSYIRINSQKHKTGKRILSTKNLREIATPRKKIVPLTIPKKRIKGSGEQVSEVLEKMMSPIERHNKK